MGICYLFLFLSFSIGGEGLPGLEVFNRFFVCKLKLLFSEETSDVITWLFKFCTFDWPDGKQNSAVLVLWSLQWILLYSPISVLFYV